MIQRALAAAALLAASLAGALEPPRIEYSADSHVETADGAFDGKVFAAPGKERREVSVEGDVAVIITRHDRKVAWMLVPEEKAYVEMKPGESADTGDLSGLEVEQTVVGPEKVDGIETTKSKIVARAPDGSKFGGFWWTTRDGIVVKMDALSVEKGRRDRIALRLTNLRVGHQDPALFEVPRGFSRMSVPGMAGMPAAPGKPGAGKAGKASVPPEAQDALREAMKLFR